MLNHYHLSVQPDEGNSKSMHDNTHTHTHTHTLSPVNLMRVTCSLYKGQNVQCPGSQSPAPSTPDLISGMCCILPPLPESADEERSNTKRGVAGEARKEELATHPPHQKGPGSPDRLLIAHLFIRSSVVNSSPAFSTLCGPLIFRCLWNALKMWPPPS